LCLFQHFEGKKDGEYKNMRGKVKAGRGAGRASLVGSHPLFVRSSLSQEYRKKEDSRNVRMSNAK